jgi:hypothetical protein
MVLLVAGLLVASLALGHAWAQEGKGKDDDDDEDDEKEDKGRDEKGNNGNGSEDRRGRARSSDLPPASIKRALGDSLAAIDTSGISGIFGRAAADSIILQEAPPELAGVFDTDAADNTVAPTITVTSPMPLRTSTGQAIEITFDSTAAGTYTVVITRGSSYDSQTLAGQMQAGANSVVWEATDGSGAPVPDDRYVYYITAKSAEGVREPPAAGDGAIMVVTPLSIPASVDASMLLMVAGSAAAAGAAALFFARRRRSVTIFVPIEAEAVVDDIRERHPEAAVANYIDSKTDGVRRYIGVTIPKGADDEWLVEIADKAKEMAQVDSVSLRYRGKMHVL